jgi:hypothetical protein
LNDFELGSTIIQSGAQDYLVKAEIHGGMLARCIQFSIERNKFLQQALKKTPEAHC